MLRRAQQLMRQQIMQFWAGGGTAVGRTWSHRVQPFYFSPLARSRCDGNGVVRLCQGDGRRATRPRGCERALPGEGEPAEPPQLERFAREDSCWTFAFFRVNETPALSKNHYYRRKYEARIEDD